MDAFYASVEQRDNPKLRGKPLAVGGMGRRGVISAASYEARKYGVRSAMPAFMAKEKCRNLIFVSPRFDVYKKVSVQIREIFKRYTDIIEPLSLDEAFLDVTENKINLPSASIIAKRIKLEIKTELNLIASAGVSYNKFLAKIASDYDKPDGFFLVKPEDAEKFIENLPVEKFFGVGKVTAKKMHSLSIKTGSDLKKYNQQELYKLFGKQGRFYYQIVRGVDNRPVQANRIRKSIGAEQTFEKDIEEKEELKMRLLKIADVLSKRCIKAKAGGRTITLKIKYYDFKQITLSKTVAEYIMDNESITYFTLDLFEDAAFLKPVRLLGLSLSNLNISEKNVSVQLSFKFAIS